MADYFKINTFSKGCEKTTQQGQTSTQNIQRVSLSQKPDEVCFSTKNNKPSFCGELEKTFLSTPEVKLTDEELKDINTRFKKLFLREDITLEDTKNMINEYLALESIQDNKEYAKAVYEVAKKNYGFKDIDLPLVFMKGEPLGKNKKIGGGASRTLHQIKIDSTQTKESFLSTIHHELRHVKQYYYSACLDKEMYCKNAVIAGIREINERRKDKIIINTENLDKTVINNVIDDITSRWGELSPEKVPEQYKVWASIMLDTLKDYVPPQVNINEYRNHLQEKDANLAGAMIVNIMRMAKNKT